MTLHTDRLILRTPQMEDAESLAHHANDRAVSRWLLKLPYPYTIEDARTYIASQQTRSTAGQKYVIYLDGAAVGTIGTVGEFGYWLGRAHWGQGLMTEAAHAVLIRHFETDRWDLKSSHATGNDRSARILQNCGFRYTGQEQRRVGVRADQDNMHHLMELTHADWQVHP